MARAKQLSEACAPGSIRIKKGKRTANGICLNRLAHYARSVSGLRAGLYRSREYRLCQIAVLARAWSDGCDVWSGRRHIFHWIHVVGHSEQSVTGKNWRARNDFPNNGYVGYCVVANDVRFHADAILSAQIPSG